MKAWMRGVCGIIAAGVTFSLSANDLHFAFGAKLELSAPVCIFEPVSFTAPGWGICTAQGGFRAEKDGGYAFTLKTGDVALKGRARFSGLNDGKITAFYAVTPEKDITVNGLCISGRLRGSLFFGGTALCDGKTVTVPRERKAAMVISRRLSSITVTTADGRQSFCLSFPKPTHVLLQDNRSWNDDSLSLRISFDKENTLKAGVTSEAVFTLSAVPAIDRFFPLREVKIQEGKEWIPLRVDPEIAAGSALDFSGVGGIDAPAGKYGRVVAKGANFEFEKKPGVPQRFYGVNLCFTANFFSLEDARTLARRLARTGYNAVRLHHYDGGLTEGSKDGTALNPQKLKEIDNVIAACMENGLYVTTDLFVSRAVPYRAVGIDRDGNIPMDEYKSLVQVHEGAFENLKRFSRLFLEHVNPHTGRRYAEEPALAWLAFVNEGNPGNHGGKFYKESPEAGKAWKTWIAQKKATDPATWGKIGDSMPGNIWASKQAGAVFSLFLLDIEQNFDRRFRAFLADELHCRALLTNMSSWSNPVCYQVARSAWYDYVDDHFYIDHPHFLENPWNLPSRCGNVNPMCGSSMGAHAVAFRRLLDKPFTITEYNYSGPGRFRGVGGIATGAQAALQNWGGVWRFAWSHSAYTALHPESARMGYFDMAGDPLSLAAERASICLFLRRDLAPLSRTYALVLPQKKVLSDTEYSPYNRTDWSWMSWYAQIGTLVADAAPAGVSGFGVYPDVYKSTNEEMRKWLAPNGKMPPAGDGAVSIDAETGTFLLKTPRTCGGFAEKGLIEAGDLIADIGETAATVWVSSLNTSPVRSSSRLLVTHLTDVQNTGITYADRQLTILLNWGRLPHLMRVGRAKLSIAVDGSRYAVYKLTSGGIRRGRVASSVEGGRLHFLADTAFDRSNAVYLYEVVRE